VPLRPPEHQSSMLCLLGMTGNEMLTPKSF
jgi:hypothetical protein